MARPKTTARHASCKIIAGSALDRLTEGRSFTEVVHQIAEMYWNAGGRPLSQQGEPDAPQGQIVVEPKSEPSPRPAPEHVEERNARMAATLDPPPGRGPRPRVEAVYAVPDPDTGEIVQVGYDEAMRLMKQQCPAGLEPVLDAFMVLSETGDTDEGDTVSPEQVEEEPFEYEQLA